MVTKRKRKMDKMNENQQLVETITAVAEVDISEEAAQQIEKQLAVETKEINEASLEQSVAKVPTEDQLEVQSEDRLEDQLEVHAETQTESQTEPTQESHTTSPDSESEPVLEDSENNPLLTAWTQTYHSANLIQQELENWSLQLLEQQKVLSQQVIQQSEQPWNQLISSMSTFFPQNADVLTEAGKGYINLWMNTQDQYEYMTKASIEQNKLARDTMQSWVESSVVQLQQMSKSLYPNK
ncbi:hypothetical protein [Ammoniphilus sp. CFH 90114]|uniref:hypothetical protein n=1 Tax=Ammoniphilus sp. CFH 90114 TaxID=2493665 RepID=UPI00100ED119|nr:hypothetical protein [Ammoniphilus sp. CFH 90114]RXT02862.1 hypothetical protein EIZ39_24030 [Ammoniphilus sp. CFH 90114]